MTTVHVSSRFGCWVYLRHLKILFHYHVKIFDGPKLAKRDVSMFCEQNSSDEGVHGGNLSQ